MDYTAFAIENARREFQGATKMYDTKCYDLAEAFLSDEGVLNTTANTERLAQMIQDVIEDEIADLQIKEHGGIGAIIDPRD